VDLAGLELVVASMEGIKMYGEIEKLPFIASIIAQDHHKTRCFPCLLFQPIYTRIVPKYEARTGKT